MSEVDPKIAEECYSQCRINIKGWEHLADEDIKLTPVTGGLTNVLTLATADKKKLSIIEPCPEKVLVRHFGKNTETFFNREQEESVFQVFSDYGLAPKILGHFPDGRLEEFLEAITLTSDELPDYLPEIGAKMAAIHHIETDTISREPVLFTNLINWWTAAKKVKFPESKPDEKKLLASIDLEQIRKEIDWLKKILAPLQSPVRLCHNDLLAANILKTKETRELHAIDFEYGAYNYRGYDIGNHFDEWIIDYTHKEFPKFKIEESREASDGNKRVFFKAYLKEWKRLEREPTDVGLQELDDIMKECDHYQMAPHLLWGLWGICQADHSKIDFGYMQFAEGRLGQFFRLKKELCAEYGYEE